jgi:hypothetical protein
VLELEELEPDPPLVAGAVVPSGLPLGVIAFWPAWVLEYRVFPLLLLLPEPLCVLVVLLA